MNQNKDWSTIKGKKYIQKKKINIDNILINIDKIINKYEPELNKDIVLKRDDKITATLKIL